MNRFVAYCIIVLSTVLGRGSLLLFGAFLVAGPFTIIRIDASEGQALVWNGSLSTLFFIQHSGMIRVTFRNWLSSAVPRHYHPATYAIASGIVLLKNCPDAAPMEGTYWPGAAMPVRLALGCPCGLDDVRAACDGAKGCEGNDYGLAW